MMGEMTTRFYRRRSRVGIDGFVAITDLRRDLKKADAIGAETRGSHVTRPFVFNNR